MALKIKDLIAQLKAYEEEFGDIDVRMAQQQWWSAEYSIESIGCSVAKDADDAEVKPIVYLNGRSLCDSHVRNNE